MRNNLFSFLKQHAYFLLGGACILVVGLLFLLGRGSPPGLERGVLVYDSGNPEIVGVVDSAEEEEEASSQSPENDNLSVAEPEPKRKIVVHIVGAVARPGVYEVYEGSRVNDVLTMAGGETPEADLSRVNLAAVAVDAMQIIVPEFGEETGEVFVYSSAGEAASGQNKSGGLININTATLQELQNLPGVGPVLAQNIVSFRETHGNFSSVDELIHVSRVGAATLERLRPLVTVG